MYQYSDWRCGSCERSFCIAIDDEESKGKDTCVCPHCGSKSVTPAEESGPPTQENGQPGAAAPLGMLALLDTVRNLNGPGDNPQVPGWCGLPSTWFSPEERCRLAQLRLERQALFVRCKRAALEWSELEVRQLLFLKGIRFRSNVDAGEELGVSRSRVDQKYRDLCSVFGLTQEVDED
ncbi:hypothetical protein INS49_001677 [Diaporthe citri]|uniref:uncharacterized protein n=1 Tax=Diaporthe citri TaxID=83186 RepID=UPI001C7F8F83|nr:uncharacterized protein INS49_001677 [Diaporthe citri]KAG6367487.1 hypothetical protein INS49_001677 [Diaporthe citri]